MGNSDDGILVSGTHHLLKRIVFENDPVLKGISCHGVRFLGGDNHTIEDSTFVKFGPYFKWDIIIESANTTAKYCTCYATKVAGEGACLSNVESRNLIRIKKFPDSIQLLKCKSKKLNAEGKVSMTDCDFSSLQDISRPSSNKLKFWSGWFP